MKALVLAEKPSVAREIARVLKCNVKNKGFLEDLPMLPASMKLKVIRQTSHQFQVVRNLMKREDLKELVIATDAGREGELVARWIMVLYNWKKPILSLKQNTDPTRH
jgi:DNA topoisomerase-3